MRKFLGLPMAAALIVAVAGVSQAQTGQGCGGTVQSYQRYSYQPAPTGAMVRCKAVQVVQVQGGMVQVGGGV